MEYPPDRYHLHVDGTECSAERLDRLMQLGFRPAFFDGHPDGYPHFEPAIHLTRRFVSHEDFRAGWDAARELVVESEFVGYLEGELIAARETLPERPFDPAVPLPFRLTRRRLAPDGSEPFRQVELHLTLDRDRSDPRLIRCLLEAGLFGAYLPKADHRALVLTIQALDRSLFVQVARSLRGYLLLAGGMVRGVLKREVAIAHQLCRFSPSDLPEVIASATFNPLLPVQRS